MKQIKTMLETFNVELHKEVQQLYFACLREYMHMVGYNNKNVEILFVVPVLLMFYVFCCNNVNLTRHVFVIKCYIFVIMQCMRQVLRSIETTGLISILVLCHAILEFSVYVEII